MTAWFENNGLENAWEKPGGALIYGAVPSLSREELHTHKKTAKIADLQPKFRTGDLPNTKQKC
jgi:hypothetical protein